MVGVSFRLHTERKGRLIEFEGFAKIPRLNRDCTITEKIDGTNACIVIETGDLNLTNPATVDTVVYAQSRTRIITPKEDNYGFAAWVESNKYALAVLLGPGRHFGEWWGQGIQRNYGLCEKRFALFNTARWSKLDYDQWKALTDIGVDCVPILYEGPFSTGVTTYLLWELARYGSSAVPGFMKPEGIVIWHQAARCYFKATIENDAEWKGKQNG